jgi:hypothetical protein
MNKELTDILTQVNDFFQDKIDPKSNSYSLVHLGSAAKACGYDALDKKYLDEKIIIPLKDPKGINFFFSGAEFQKTFKDYVQLSSGIVLAPYIAKEADMSGTTYVPHKQMTLVM